ncbi:MAG: PAS domain S-box protein [Spirochaetes bacterium]|nr:PAS domain S-box protein [Spirochaetota bacterium]
MTEYTEKTILIVDDETLIAMNEARILREQGYTVLVAHSGEDAIQTASQHPIPDLILMDIDLGSGMDGTRAAEIILKNLDIPVLFLSNHTEPAMVDRTEKITSYGYVVKNSGETVLLASIKMAFRLHNAHLELKKHGARLTEALLERRRAEEELQKSEERYRSFFEKAASANCIIGEDTKFILVNSNLEKLTGYGREELEGRMSWTSLIVSEDLKKMKQYHAQRMSGTGDPPQTYECRARTKSGEIRNLFISISMIPGRNESVSSLIDITELKRAEEALSQNEERFSNLANLLPETVFETDINGRITFVNEPSLERFGYTRDEVERGLSFLDIIVPEEHRRGTENFGKALRGELFGLVEYTARKKNGTRFPVLINTSIIIRDGGPAGLRGFLLDITGQKNAEEKLKMFQYTIDQASEMVLWLTPDGRFEYVNDETCRSLGYTREELMAMNLWDIGPSLPRHQWNADMARYRKNKTGGSTTFESVHRRKDGSEYPIEVRAQFLWFGERELHVAVVRNIAERKKAMQALRESEERFSELARFLPEVVFETDMQGRLTFVNQVGLDKFGYTVDDIDRGLIITNLVVPKDRERALENIAKMLKGENLGLREYQALGKDGSTFPVLVHSTAKVRDGTTVGLRGFLVDITEQKKTEEALRESEERWSFALEGAGDGVWDWNAQTNKVHFSRQWKAMLGYEEHEIGDTLDEWDSRVHPHDRERVYADLKRHLEGKSLVYLNEHRLRCKNGEYKYILDRGKVFSRTPEGRPLRVIGTHTDITRRREAEERYTTFMQTALNGFVIFDRSWRIVEANEAYAQMSGYIREELTGKHVSELEADLNIDEITSISKSLQNRGSIRFETRHRKKDGTLIDVEVSIRIHEDKIPYEHTFVIIRDISEKKKAEIALENSIREKESLFHELQHRTKNSLNMITSLISLEMNREENAGARTVLENLKGRILSVANLYAILSMSGLETSVNLDDYLQSIVASVVSTYLSGMSAITIEKKYERITAEPKNSTAWGLIANELLTNALKYAFPPGVAGVIRIRLRKTNGSIELAVSDNGAGPPADFSIDNPKGFGILLVKMLTRQLGGSFTFERNGENVFSVRVPETPVA